MPKGFSIGASAGNVVLDDDAASGGLLDDTDNEKAKKVENVVNWGTVTSRRPYVSSPLTL